MSFRYGMMGAACWAFVAIVAGCAPAPKPPILTAELCLREESDLSPFAESIKAIGRSEGMEIHDRSAEASAELRKLAENGSEAAGWYSSPILVVRIERADGLALSASNAGLRNKIALNISAGDNQTEAKDFRDLTLSRLREQWVVRELTPGAGVQADPACG